jgi:hypothetical protein
MNNIIWTGGQVCDRCGFMVPHKVVQRFDVDVCVVIVCSACLMATPIGGTV